ncbi:hypothetical protein [Micromonospora sp. NPDC126480]|uniref:hypothetical protein n=1 Tax=Micromonospora sp. NPDC126480 TaxID=3155312 RepID=UPI0033273A10
MCELDGPIPTLKRSKTLITAQCSCHRHGRWSSVPRDRPWLPGRADLWWRTLLGCLATPTLQAVAFSAGISLLIDPEANLPILLGLPGSDTLNLLLVIVVLWVTVRIPGMMRRYVTRAGSPNMGGVLLRAVFIQGITRTLPFGRLARVRGAR